MPAALSKRRTVDEWTAPAAIGWPSRQPSQTLDAVPAQRAVTRAGEYLRAHSVRAGTKASSVDQLRAYAAAVLDDWQRHLARDDERHAVYQLHDDRGRLLYAGSTSHLAERLRQHAKRQPWWQQVAHRTVEYFPNREAAAVREADLIVRLSPLHNRHVPRPEPTVVLAARTYLDETA